MIKLITTILIVLLSFGFSYWLDFYVVPTGGVYGSGADTLNTNTAFAIEFNANFTSGDETRLAWSSPFLFYGQNGLTTLDGPGTLTSNPDFQDIWDMGYFTTYMESWDGDLTNSDGGQTGDLFNVSGIDFSAPHLPSSGSMWLFTQDFPGITSGSADYLGDFCVTQGDAINNTYDWLFEDPSPSFGPVCFPVKLMPNAAPQFTNCPTATIVGEWNEAFGHDLDATDAEQDPFTFEMVSGPGDVDPSSGMWTWQPTCDDVGSHQVVVCVTDAAHQCPTGFECTFNVQVNNTPPEIGGDCGDAVIVGTGSSKTAHFTATDDNGGTLTWSVVSIVPAFSEVGSSATIDQTGELTFTADPDEAEDDYVVTVRVTDCNDEYAECSITFTVLGALKFDIVIQKVEDQIQGHHGYVNVYKTQGTEEMWGFDFLIGYDASALTFLQATRGAGIDGWEYFTYRYNWNGNCGNGCPSGLLRVTAIADENDGPHHPPAGAVSVPDGSVLFTLDFLVTNNYNYQGQFVPINFYWVDCGDNTIAFHYKAAPDPLEIRTAMSKVPTEGVYWYYGWDPVFPYMDQTDPYFGFPTFTGAQMECFCDPPDYDSIKCPVPYIDFFGGGIDIIPVGNLDDRGDVNLNGVANEIADAVVFTNYFIYGPAAFTINYEGQKAATEINGDGIALTVADLVYLIRVIVGDALPLPAFKPVPTTLHVTSGEVSVDNAIGAGQFVFAGNVDVTLAEGAKGMELQTNYHDGQTYAILYSFEKGVTANGHILNSEGQLVSVEAATYEGASFKDINIMPSNFAVKSYPNPFNPVATVEMSLPSASDWTITVFNVVGQRVADFNGHSDAGVVKVQWDASNEASGIYFYKVDAGKYSVTKKMVLLK
jgi:hypothetical protein